MISLTESLADIFMPLSNTRSTTDTWPEIAAMCNTVLLLHWLDPRIKYFTVCNSENNRYRHLTYTIFEIYAVASVHKELYYCCVSFLSSSMQRMLSEKTITVDSFGSNGALILVLLGTYISLDSNPHSVVEQDQDLHYCYMASTGSYHQRLPSNSSLPSRPSLLKYEIVIIIIKLKSLK